MSSSPFVERLAFAKAAAIAASLLMGASLSASAQSTWTGAINGDWNETGNWSPAEVPTAGSLVFGSSPNSTIEYGDNTFTRTYNTILFTQDSQGYTFNYAGSNPYGQTVNGNATLRNSYGAGSVTYNSGLRITSGNAWDIINDSLTSMTFNGALQGNRSTAASVFRFSGIGGGTINGPIQELHGTHKTTVQARGGGTWAITGSSTITGTTYIRSGATLALDYRNNNTRKLSDTAILELEGGRLQILGNAGGTTVTVGGLAVGTQTAVGINYGFASSIGSQKSEDGNITVTLGPITTSTSSVLRITGDARYNASLTTAGNIIYNNDYAAVASGTVRAYAGYTALPGSGGGSNTTIYSTTGNTTVAPSTNFEALGIKVSSSGSGQSLDFGTGNLILAAAGGSLLYTGEHDYTIKAASFGRNANTGVTHWINTGTATLTLQGPIGSGTAQFRTSGEGTIRLETGRTGAANRVHVGEGTLIFAANDITGTTANTANVQSGATLALENNITVNQNTVINLHGLGAGGNGALRNLSGNNTVAGGVNLGFTSRITADAGILTLQGALTDSGTESALLVNGAGNVVINSSIGSSALVYGIDKSGAGTLTLNGANSYTGQTVVSGGLLAVNGGGLTGSHVLVKNGGTLGGSGPINGTVTVQNGGTLSPGNSPGNQVVSTLELNGGGSYLWQVHDASGSAGTGYDTYTVGNLDLTGLLSPFKFTIQLESLAAVGPDTPGLALGFNPLEDGEWMLASFTTVNTTGLNVGHIGSYFAVNTSSFLNPFPGEFSVTLANNALLLQYTAVPEPGTLLLLLPATALVLRTMRRRKA